MLSYEGGRNMNAIEIWKMLRRERGGDIIDGLGFRV